MGLVGKKQVPLLLPLLLLLVLLLLLLLQLLQYYAEWNTKVILVPSNSSCST